MKIGVALSGCDIGGVGAYGALRELEAQGFEIGMISACGIPAIPAMLYAYGYGPQSFERAAGEFLKTNQESDMDMAVAELAAKLSLRQTGGLVPLAVNTVNISDGKICAFSGSDLLRTSGLCTFPLEDAYDALSATISPADGLTSYEYQGCKLCDFCVWYGQPVQPLRLAGLEKILSLTFVPRSPGTPYQGMVKQKISATANLCDLHIPIELEGPATLEQYIKIATTETKSCIKDALPHILF